MDNLKYITQNICVSSIVYFMSFVWYNYSTNMGSINAQRVAQKVAEKVRRNELVNLGQIIRETGYAKNVAEHPDRVTKTKSYKKAYELEIKPVLQQFEEHRQKILNAIAVKDLNAEEYRTLIGSLDIMTKNAQLLSGGATSKNVFVLPSEVIQRNEIVIKSSDVLPIDPQSPTNGST